MNPYKYQTIIKQTAIYPKEIGILYCALGLASESGEVCDKIKKIYRDFNGNFSDEKKQEIAYEISDVIWYCTALSMELGYDLESIMQMNYDKLTKRKETNTLQGEGDKRHEIT